MQTAGLALARLTTAVGIAWAVFAAGCGGKAEIHEGGSGGTGASNGTTSSESTTTSDGAGGSSVSSSSSEMPGCETPEECPAPQSLCAKTVCDDGLCGIGYYPAGTPAGDSTPGDCQTEICDGAGAFAVVNDDSDVPVSFDECASVYCSGGVVSVNLLTGAPCAAGGGKVCENGICVECLWDNDCDSLICQQGVCAPSSCADGVKNGSETDVDCGGSACPGCSPGYTCADGSDCDSFVCWLNVCQAPQCNDGVKNGTETDVDCGGVCLGCGFLDDCLQDADCAIGFCGGGLCQGAGCGDGVLNGTETGVDCGGGACQRCPETITCLVDTDCLYGLCVAGICDAPPSCEGGGEGTDLHCGATDEPCCKRPLAPGGSYYRYNDASLALATMANVEMEAFNVTVGRFRKFVNAGMGVAANPPATGSGAYPYVANSGWQQTWSNANKLPATTQALKTSLTNSAFCTSGYGTWTDQPGANEKKPIVCVTWYEAYAFCIWDGGRLPTENEYDYVWTGGSQQRTRPWGEAVTSDLYASYDCRGDGDGGGGGQAVPGACDPEDILDVGSYPAGAGYWGHQDLIGNASSWMRNRWSTMPILPVPCAGNCLNLAQQAAQDIYVYRGGGAIAHWHAPFSDFDPYVDRLGNFQYEGNEWRGFRCAR